MARLQSFDDSFVFQGKLNQDLLPMWNAGFSQKEIVVNGTPPLFAKAIGQIILKSIQ
jgi:DNA (cytosine-5)-methyltransferase 1